MKTESDLVVQRQSAPAAIESIRALGETRGRIVAAKEYPRDIVKATQQIIEAFGDIELARVATYQYARGGTDIFDLSIRAAEAIALIWGNIDAGVIEVSQRYGESDITSFAVDLENNRKESRTFTVKHVRDRRGGGSELVESSRDIYEVTANAAARRKRSCILDLIPPQIKRKVLEQIDKTLSEAVTITPEYVAKTIEAWSKLNVTKDMLEKRLQRNLEAMNKAQAVGLVKIYTSIKDGIATVGEFFEVPAPQNGNGAAADGKTKSEQLADELGAATGTAAATPEDAGPQRAPAEPKLKPARKREENANAQTLLDDGGVKNG